MRVLVFLVALLCGLPSFAANRCALQQPSGQVALGEVRLAYQAIGRERDPALLLIMGLGGQLIHWPDEVYYAKETTCFLALTSRSRSPAWTCDFESKHWKTALSLPLSWRPTRSATFSRPTQARTTPGWT
jgi:hypothetical protein